MTIKTQKEYNEKGNSEKVHIKAKELIETGPPNLDSTYYIIKGKVTINTRYDIQLQVVPWWKGGGVYVRFLKEGGINSDAEIERDKKNEPADFSNSTSPTGEVK